MPIRTIDPVCPQAILTQLTQELRVTQFPSGMLSVTNILSISGNDTLFCSELNGKNAGESFVFLQAIVFQIY